jgi:hypothetical protein
MNKLSWAETVRRVHNHAAYRCEYCQAAQRIIGQSMHVEHIKPDGSDDLCLSCPTCNLSKAKVTTTHDPDMGKMTERFNSRKQGWSEHFRWAENGTVVQAITPTGRATVARLRMNLPRLIESRSIWVYSGVHPPGTD